MNRRDFIKASGLGATALALNGLPVSVFADTTNHLRKLRGNSDRIFVFVVLGGGNDGLNTVLNLDRYSELSAARSNVLIPANQALTLAGNNVTALHPSMTGMRDMYNNGLLNITQGVGYADFNYSHFRASDIYSSGSDANVYLDSGWVGRYLTQRYPGAPNAYPSADMLDPLAVQIGSSINPMLTGPQGQIGFALSDVNNFYQIVNGAVDPAPNSYAGKELTYIRYISLQTQSYTQSVQTAANAGTNTVTYPTTNRLAEQLGIVAKLISGGLKSPFYIVETGGYDTHSDQVDAANTTTGAHAELLGHLSEAIQLFYTDLKNQGKDKNVAGCTITEFGRRIKSNASTGTDHGAAAPLFSFGTDVVPGINGTSPVLPANATQDDQIPMQYDFRQVYSSILQDWFGLDVANTTSVLGNNYATLPIWKKHVDPASIEDTAQPTSQSISIYPNPVSSHAGIQFYTEGGTTQVNLYDDMGKLVRRIYENELPKGDANINFERDGLASGTYFVEIYSGYLRQSAKLVIQ
ncbi:MAG: hypothetical protein RL660_109 [Bacteroidota bacterium]|jgi:uncharacterized protein (DUF1501 family)